MRARASPTRSRSRIRRAAARRGRCKLPDAAATPVDRTCSPSASSAARCGIAYEDPQPRLFSFNNPFGACPTCHGFGNIIELDMDLVVPDQPKSINQGAIEPWTKPHYRSHLAELKRAAKTRRRAARRAVARSDRRRDALRRGRRRRRLRGHARLLPLARAEEIQGARPRVPEPLSRLPDLPGLRRHAAAPRSARRARRRRDDRQGVGAHRARGGEVLRRRCS